MIIRRLDSVLCPVYTHRHKPMKNPTARPPSQRTRGGEEVKSESNLSTFRNFKASTIFNIKCKVQASKLIQILRSILITRMLVHFRNSVLRRKKVRDLPQLNINRLIPNQAMFLETKIKEMKATLDDDNNLFSAAL